MITITSIYSVIANSVSRSKLRNAIMQSAKTGKLVGVTNKKGCLFMVVSVINNKIRVFDKSGCDITHILKKGLGL